MVDKRNSPLEARSESEAVRSRHEVQDGKNDSCCLLLLALSPQFAVSVMWIGYVIVYFSGQSTRSRAVELTQIAHFEKEWWPGNGSYRVKDYGIFFGGRSKCPCQNTCVAVCPCGQIIFWNFWCTDLVILLDSSSCGITLSGKQYTAVARNTSIRWIASDEGDRFLFYLFF